MKAARKVFVIFEQLFNDLVEKGEEKNIYMSVSDTKGHNVVHYKTYRSVSDVLNTNIKVEDDKQIDKDRLKHVEGHNRGKGGGNYAHE